MSPSEVAPVQVAMHYSIPLEAGQSGSIRERVQVIGPIFDTLPGLLSKVFLLATDGSTYTLFYIWENPGAMLTFLEGERFAAVVAKYGRPRVDTYLTRLAGFPFVQGDRLSRESGVPVGIGARLENPFNGTQEGLVAQPQGEFEVLYNAGPAKVRGLVRMSPG